MNAFFSTTAKDAPPPVDDPKLKRAYELGRQQEHAHLADRHAVKDAEASAKLAYERGRRDERARHHGSPLLTLLLLLAATAGAVVLYLAIREGSFAQGGHVVDQGIANATATAAGATQGVADKAGDALQHAGARLRGAPANAPA